MYKNRALSLICVWTLGVFIACGQDSAARGNPAQLKPTPTAGTVNVKSVVKVYLAKDTPGYSIAYDYDFPGRSSVYIKGLGIVPPKGSFRYLSPDTQLEFRDGPSGEVLTSVPLKETVVVAANPPLLGVPDETAFPAEFQSFIWDSPKSFQERANTVLAKTFRYQPRQNKELTLLKTTFTPLTLKGAPAGVRAQIALLLSFPYDPQTGRYSFHVQSLVMEGRTHSDEFRPTSDPLILHSVDSFLNNIIEEMKTGENTKP